LKALRSRRRRLHKYVDDHTYEWVAKVNAQTTTTNHVVVSRERQDLMLTTTGKNVQGQTVA